MTTVADRAVSYAAAFPKYPPLVSHGRWLYGVWFFGANYRSTGSLYGAYPPSYLRRLQAVFCDLTPAWRVLHAFSGSLPRECEIPGVRVDLHPDRPGDVRADVQKLPFADETFDLALADTPYGPRHAAIYGVPMVDRTKAVRELGRVLKIGGHLVWLDVKRPMYRKAVLHEWGSIGCRRSTNHDDRFVTIWTKIASSSGGLTTES